MIDSDKSISGGNTEDNSLKEQTVYYDIRLNARTPGEKTVYPVDYQYRSSVGYGSGISD